MRAALAAIVPESVAVPGDLVEAMCSAMRVSWEKRTGKTWEQKDEDGLAPDLSAALAVVLNDPRVLGEPTELEYEVHATISTMLSDRRAALLEPKAKTPAESPEIVYREADASAFKPRVCGLCGAWVIDQLAHTGWHNNAQLKEKEAAK